MANENQIKLKLICPPFEVNTGTINEIIAVERICCEKNDGRDRLKLTWPSRRKLSTGSKMEEKPLIESGGGDFSLKRGNALNEREREREKACQLQLSTGAKSSFPSDFSVACEVSKKLISNYD
ncbi:hypothetical protein RUM43_011174 [Polyplax serrata]|uniref:Uncharacterized protein n=1 Tax=Polyplax serrata TaxID=468196 RepID=A0AAN8NTB3_POLSC